MSKEYQFIADQDDKGERLDRFISVRLPDVSRSKIQKEIEEGNVRINSEVKTLSRQSVHPGFVIDIAVQEDPGSLSTSSIPLDILFEDEAILVINKPSGMVVHPTTFKEEGTLIQAILNERPEIGQAVYDPEKAISRMRPGIVHRLDKDTTGVIVVAKTTESMAILAKSFKERVSKKLYSAIVFGWIPKEETIDAPLYRKGSGDKNRMAASHKPGIGKPASTTFAPLGRFAYDPVDKVVKSEKEPLKQPDPEGRLRFTYSDVRIMTGRTHQIRVHGKFFGHPVLGDTLYANRLSENLSKSLGIQRQMLHARSITITHPLSGKEITFEAPLPEDMRLLITE